MPARPEGAAAALPAKSQQSCRAPPDAPASLHADPSREAVMSTNVPSDREPARRRFLADLTVFALAAAGAPLLRAQPRLADAGAVRHWLQQVEALSRRLRDGVIDSAQWRGEIDALAATTPLPEFLPLLQFDRALAALRRDGHDPAKTFVTLAEADGTLRKAAFAAAYFVFAKGQVITPHGHRGMVSAHAVVSGRLQLRTYDRLGHDGDALLLKPRLDTVATAGFSAAISAVEGNVHWFVAEQDGSATLDVIVQDIDANGREFALELVDPLAAETDARGVLRAPLIDWEQSSRRYQPGDR
jgi:hypothetical protein